MRVQFFIKTFLLLYLSVIPLAEAKQLLFASREFPNKSFKALPQWEAVLEKMKGDDEWLMKCRTNIDECGGGSFENWANAINKNTQVTDIRRLLTKVNRIFNKSKYKLDIDNFGQQEYWASVKEFLEKSGDCEDYAITKYYVLRALGVSADNLRVVAVKDQIRGIGHAILAVYDRDKVYILDNLSAVVLPQERLPHYSPQFSVNENMRWTHFSVR